MIRHTISVLVENKFGVLARIAGLFSGRGYNIHTLNVAPSEDPKFSRMTIVVQEKEHVLNQIIKLLEKLVNVVEVIDFREGKSSNRELVLFTAKTTPQLIELVQLFEAKIIDVTTDLLSIEFTGNEVQVEEFLALLKNHDVQILTRTGKIALPSPQH